MKLTTVDKRISATIALLFFLFATHNSLLVKYCNWWVGDRALSGSTVWNISFGGVIQFGARLFYRGWGPASGVSGLA